MEFEWRDPRELTGDLRMPSDQPRAGEIEKGRNFPLLYDLALFPARHEGNR